MPDAYDRITLLCRLKAAQTRNKELESGERYVRLKRASSEGMQVIWIQDPGTAERSGGCP